MKIQFIYFKTTGKYYATGECEAPVFCKEVFQIHEYAKSLIKLGEMPGLAKGFHNFGVLIDCPDHPMNFPRFIYPSLNNEN